MAQSSQRRSLYLVCQMRDMAIEVRKMNIAGSHTYQRAQKALKFLDVAEAFRNLSKDPSTKVGAIALDAEFSVICQGYNGLPRGVDDKLEILNDRRLKYPYTQHAEANLVSTAARNGISLRGTTVLLTSLHPCSQCAGLLAQAGVGMILAPKMPENDRWDESGEIAMDILVQTKIPVILYE